MDGFGYGGVLIGGGLVWWWWWWWWWWVVRGRENGEGGWLVIAWQGGGEKDGRDGLCVWDSDGQGARGIVLVLRIFFLLRF